MNMPRIFALVVLFNILPLSAAHAVYDAGIGRWITRDPLGERAGTNQYRYVDGAPLVGSDPSGLLPYASAGDDRDIPWLPIHSDPDTNAIYGDVCGDVRFGKVTACTLDISFEGNCGSEEALYHLWRLANNPCKYLTQQIEYQHWSLGCPDGQTCRTVHYQYEYGFDMVSSTPSPPRAT